MVMTSYYTDTLYPLQDKVLATINQLGTSFYLTGGTALSRFHLHHRYSDDLDFFINDAPDFVEKTSLIVRTLRESFDLKVELQTSSYYSIVINDILKVEFVNDVAYHDNGFIKTPNFDKVDTISNILSNKLTAIIGRDEPKDVVDIWAIANNNSTDWQHIFTAANSKAVGIFPPDIARRLSEFPIDLLDRIKWIEGKSPNNQQLKADLERICNDILEIE